MKPRKVHIKSFGCQMNKLDTALVASALTELGYALVEKATRADVVLINTCSVREHAEARVLSHLGHLKHIRERRPDLVVGVIGCMAQRLGERLLEHEAVDIVCGPTQISQVAELVDDALAHREARLAVTPAIRRVDAAQSATLEQFEATYGADGVIERSRPRQAFVRVMRGCDNFCTYCIVPYVRGPEVCRPPQAILDQVQKLAEEGIRQVTLLGQTVNAYRYPTGRTIYSLADLLQMVARVAGIEWIRFVTSYPSAKFFDEILSVMAAEPKVCPYLHMPAQSGSDRILRAMNRHYSLAEYLELLDRARDAVPDISVAGDFIVGFPGETEADFQASVNLVQRARYKNCYVFKYSRRPGTRADKRLADTVADEVKQRRNVELLAVQERISDELNGAYLGREVRVLVEGLSKKAHANPLDEAGHPQLVGRTARDQIVVFNGPESLAGEFAKVHVTRTAALTLFGELSR
jgi:tRNA-2-methylthio-N6-dimethylallyladenosine synthase